MDRSAFVGSGFVGAAVGRPKIQEAASRPRKAVVAPKMTIEFVGQEGQVRLAGEMALKDFITRRSVKTLLYYLKEFHDGATANWLKRFEEFDKNEKEFYDWEGYMERMFKAPAVQCTEVQAHPKGNFRREFKFVIEPTRVAMRVLATRKHLSEEWTKDLTLMDMENLEITRMHYEVQLNPDADLDSLRGRILDVDPLDDESSPLRVQNYRYIRGLATHYAVHRLLQRMKEKSNHHFMWFSEYLESHPITPDSEVFLYTLLRENAVIRTNPDTYISPKKIATMVMNCRAAVAQEWIADLESIHEENLTVQRKILEARASKLLGDVI